MTVFKALKFSNEEMVQLQRKKKGKMPTTLLVWHESWGVQFSFCGMTLSRYVLFLDFQLLHLLDS